MSFMKPVNPRSYRLLWALAVISIFFGCWGAWFAYIWPDLFYRAVFINAGLLALLLTASIFLVRSLKRRALASEPAQSVKYQGVAFFCWFARYNLFLSLLGCVAILLSLSLWGPGLVGLVVSSGASACALFCLTGLLAPISFETLGLCWRTPLDGDMSPGASVILRNRYQYAARYDLGLPMPALPGLTRILDRAAHGGADRGLNLISQQVLHPTHEFLARFKSLSLLFLVAALAAFLMLVLGAFQFSSQNNPEQAFSIFNAQPQDENRKQAEPEKQHDQGKSTNREKESQSSPASSDGEQKADNRGDENSEEGSSTAQDGSNAWGNAQNGASQPEESGKTGENQSADNHTSSQENGPEKKGRGVQGMSGSGSKEKGNQGASRAEGSGLPQNTDGKKGPGKGLESQKESKQGRGEAALTDESQGEQQPLDGDRGQTGADQKGKDGQGNGGGAGNQPGEGSPQEQPQIGENNTNGVPVTIPIPGGKGGDLLTLDLPPMDPNNVRDGQLSDRNKAGGEELPLPEGPAPDSKTIKTARKSGEKAPPKPDQYLPNWIRALIDKD